MKVEDDIRPLLFKRPAAIYSNHSPYRIASPGIVFLLLFFMFASCSVTNTSLRYTKLYTVRTVHNLPKGQTISLVGVTGFYNIGSDTLKPGDKIKINVIRKQ